MTLLTYQTMMTGAKVKPTLLVPKRWNANSRMRIAQEMPTTAPARPSTHTHDQGTAISPCQVLTSRYSSRRHE